LIQKTKEAWMLTGKSDLSPQLQKCSEIPTENVVNHARFTRDGIAEREENAHFMDVFPHFLNRPRTHDL
jgi:hypothetical protein